MAKKKETDATPPPATGDQREKTTTKVWADLIWKAKTVASYRHLDLFDYLDQLLAPQINKDFDETVQHPKKKE